MLAYITPGTGKVKRQQVRGVWILTVPMSTGGFSTLRRRRRWRMLRRMGIRRAVFALDLTQEAEKWGIRRVAVYPLRRVIWEQMLPGKGNLALVRASHVDAAVEQTAEVLLRRFRYLRLETGFGTDDLARRLLRRYGLGVGGGEASDVTVSFGGKPLAEGEICLGEDCARWQSVVYGEVDGLDGWEVSEELLCALLQSGGIKKEELRVKSILPKA